MDEKNHVINVDDDPYESLATLITKDELSRVRPYSSRCCIYRVPPRLRRVNETAYTPQVVSIGPIHHGKSFKIMEEHKWRYLKDFLGRTKRSLKHYVGIVKEMEETIRGCYEETFDLSSDKFVTIILVDAAFIVEVFLTAFSEKLGLPVEEERMPNANRVLVEAGQDFLLLENQLPFFILENFWNSATPITCMIEGFLYPYFNSKLELKLKKNHLESVCSLKPKNFVDMVRNLYIPLNPEKDGKAKPFHTPKIDQFVDLLGKLWYVCTCRKKRYASTFRKKARFHAPSVTELCQAGLEFREKESTSLFDISYSSEGTLEIPKWRVTDHTEVIFRNLIAFEQCHCALDKHYICHYRRLMDYLINTPMDVDLLVNEGIVENWLGDSSDVSRMINNLGYGVLISPSNFYFADIFGVLNDHCGSSWNEWKANLKQNYFNTPWALLSFLAALFLLGLTIIQTVCSIMSTA